MSQSSLYKFSGGQPPTKRCKSNEEKEKSAEYEKKRIRQFQERWKTGRPWLNYDAENKTMSCLACERLSKRKNGSFVIGCSVMKLEQIASHERSVDHQKSIKIENAENTPFPKTDSGKILNTENKDQTQKTKLDKLLRNAHYVAKESKPLMDFIRLVELDRAKGFDVGENYINTFALKDFLSCISDVEKQNIKEKMSKSPFFSILSDGCLDSSTTEDVIVYIRFAHRGESSIYYAGIKTGEKPDATNIYDAIVETLKTNLDMEETTRDKKLVGIVSDGASVMRGRYNGVTKKLKGEKQYVIDIHCLSHRMELGMRDALKKISLDVKCKSLLNALYAFYHRSALNRSNLKAIFIASDISPVYPKRVGVTRWVDHSLLALKNLEQGYTAIISHLEKVAENQCSISNESQRVVASGILRKLKNMSIMKYALKLLEVLSILSKLSKALQERNMHIASAQESISSTVELLNMIIIRDNCFIEEIRNNEFRKIQLNGNDNDYIEARKLLHRNLKAQLTNRLLEDTEGVLKATKIVNFNFWPDKKDYNDFGNNSIKKLTSHFSIPLQNASVALEEILNEWTLLKFKIFDENFRLENLKKISWEKINMMWSTELPNLLILVDLILSLSSSTAECERGFSAMKRIKSSEQSFLNCKTLDDLMMIHMNSEKCSSFNPDPVIDIWLTKKQRLINNLDWESLKEMTESECDIDWENASDFSDSSSFSY